MRMLSKTDRPLKRRAPWNVRAMPRFERSCGGSRVMSSPRKPTTPLSARNCPEMQLISVVLPAPFGPMRLSTLPDSAARSTSATACTPPKRFVRRRISSNIGLSDPHQPPRSRELEQGDDSAWQVCDDEDEDRALEDVAIVLQESQQLGQRGQQRGAE